MHFSLQDGQHGFLKEGTLCESAQNTVPRDCGWAPLTVTHTRILARACTCIALTVTRGSLCEFVSTLAANNSLHHVAFFYYFFHTSTIFIITSFHNYTISGASFFIVVRMLHVHHHVRYLNPSHAGTLAKEGSSKATRSTGSRPSSGCGMQRRG